VVGGGAVGERTVGEDFLRRREAIQLVHPAIPGCRGRLVSGLSRRRTRSRRRSRTPAEGSAVGGKATA